MIATMRSFTLLALSAVLPLGTLHASHVYDLRRATADYHAAAEELREEIEHHLPQPYLVQTAARLERAACLLRDRVRTSCNPSEIFWAWEDVTQNQLRMTSLLDRLPHLDRHTARRYQDLNCTFNDLRSAMIMYKNSLTVPQVQVRRPPLTGGPWYSGSPWQSGNPWQAGYPDVDPRNDRHRDRFDDHDHFDHHDHLGSQHLPVPEPRRPTFNSFPNHRNNVPATQDFRRGSNFGDRSPSLPARGVNEQLPIDLLRLTLQGLGR